MMSALPRYLAVRWFRALWVVVLPLVVSLACSDATGPGTTLASLTFNVVTPATVRTLVVTVSGPGLDSAITSNIAVGENSQAQGTLSVPAGATRRIQVVAVDTGNVRTHQADTTVRLVPGQNAPIQLVLRPLTSTVGITVTFGNVTLSLGTSDTALVTGDSLRLTATASTPWGAVPVDSLQWATDGPGAVTVSGGLVRALRTGTATVSVSFGGAVVRRRFVVRSPPRIYFQVAIDGSSTAWDIYSVKADGSALDTVVSRVGFDVIPAVSRDATKLAISSEAWCTPGCAGTIQVELYVGNVNGTGLSRITTGATAVYGKSFSPDGQRIVFESQMGTVNAADRRLYVANVAGSGVTQITTEESQLPDWSPDGSRILYCARAGIVSVSASGSGRQVLRSFSTATNPPFDCYRAVWSPNGERIVFDTVGGDIWVMNADGTGATQLTSGTALDNGPVWSPDGQEIAFHSNRSGRLQVWAMSANGSGLRQVTSIANADARDVTWR